MKKLEKLTLKELGVSMEVIDPSKIIGLKGGDSDGAAAYYCLYGESLPEGTGYDVANDVCYPLSDLGPSNNVTGTYTTTSTCVTCKTAEMSATVGAYSQAGNAGQAMLYLTYVFHDLGYHEKRIIRETTYQP